MRCGPWLTFSARKVFPYAAPFLMLLTLGCRSAGPVHKLTIDSANVESILFEPGAPFVLKDRGFIARVVSEINGLSFTPYPKPYMFKPLTSVVLKDKSGKVIVEIAGGGDFIAFMEPQSVWFYVKKDSSVETVGRILGYANYLDDIDTLKFYANQAVWDETDRRMTPFRWEQWVPKLYPEPYRSWPAPVIPQELSERLKSLPILTLDDLEKFPEYL